MCCVKQATVAYHDIARLDTHIFVSLWVAKQRRVLWWIFGLPIATAMKRRPVWIARKCIVQRHALPV